LMAAQSNSQQGQPMWLGGRTEEVRRLMCMGRRTGDFARAIVAVVLFSILMAVWVWLWVPSVRVF
jgi:hypothetical protein